MAVKSGWLDSVHPNPAARLRLFCFAHAGSGASFFSQWWRKFPSDVEVCPVQLPGRWARWRDEPLRDLLQASRSIVEELTPALTAKPCVFYGHSLGGLVAYETIVRMREKGSPLPRALAVSSLAPPSALLGREPLHELTDDAFLRGVAAHYEPIDPRVLADPEMGAMFLKVLRADLEMFEKRQPTLGAPLDLPVWVFAGTEDRCAAPADMQDWKTFSTRPVVQHDFAGGHFFVRDSAAFWRRLSDLLTTV